ncbi:SURF1 family protein [Novosphingobium sp. JCM 18896]|uniref:SURF1 family protein n=1 Tax=Novosphingobium sp. JCM 18896 TaxID=2989731 RepID=UPI0022223A41|nr:SURF1 family protein [Novosphingobium sp. JCM 18896]MCW1429710.1 SURF1 family protein [Novosphingobium sp. JCM 18896]
MKKRWFLALALLGAVLFAALGIWQVERRAWKHDLIARVEARIHAPPVAFSDISKWRGLTPDAYEYRKVRLRGVFRHDREALVQALTERGAGFWVLTPLRTDAGTVLINRGFVPGERRAAETRREGQVAGEVAVTGLMRASEPGGGFLRANDPAADRWYSRDVAAIARARGLGPVASFFVDADAAANPGGYPLGGLTVVRFADNHLVYALTWFALAGLCLWAGLTALRPAQRESNVQEN